MAYKLGGNARIYIGTPGSVRVTWPGSGAPVGLTAIAHVGDLKLPIDFNKLDATTRDNPGFEVYFAGLAAAGVDFQLKYDAADSTYQTLRSLAFGTARNTIPVAVLDGDKAVTGTEGLWMDGQVFKWDKGEEVKGLQTIDVSIAPAQASGTNALGPQWVVVGTGPIS